MPSTCNRKVNFSANVKGMAIPRIYDYTKSEINAIWYNEDDMDRFTRRAIKVIKKMENPHESRKYCIRGLEGYSIMGSISKKRNRFEAREAVFQEQDRQQWNGYEECSSDQAIADAYRQITSSCQMWAQAMGYKDQIAAEAYLLQEEDEDNEKTTEQPRTFEISDSKLPAKPETRLGALKSVSSPGLIHLGPPAA